MTFNEDGSPDWSAWNKAQRRSVERFRLSNPSGPLVVLSVAIQPLVVLSQYIIDIHSDTWAKEQEVACAQGRPCLTVGVELLVGRGLPKFGDQLQKLFWDPAAWAIVAPEHRTYRLRALAFSVLARAFCGAWRLVC